MARPIRIGVQLQPQHAPHYSAIRDAVRRCEDIGVDIAFNWDHFFPLYGDRDGPHFECWTMLADMARTVDHIGGGRLILGIGAGWKLRDYREYGYDFGTAGSRLDDLADALPLIKTRLAQLNPPPTRAIPTLIGGGGERKTLRLVAEYADMWHSFADADSYPHKAQVLARHCAAVGRDPGEIEHSAAVGGETGRSPISDVLAEADALTALGVSLLTIGSSGPDYDLSAAEALCRWRDQR